MKPIACFLMMSLLPLCAAEEGFTSLFNGKDFTGWKVNENTDTFTIKDGAIVAHGPRSHCFYVGDFKNHTFKDFELKVDVMTLPGSNGGVYIETDYQDKGWPAKGFEVQVNNTFKGDPRRTGSLYEVKDNGEEVAKDNKWFTEDIIAKGDTITVKVDGKGWWRSGRSRRVGRAQKISRDGGSGPAPSPCRATMPAAPFITRTSASSL
jgi:Domain of Unknown Function (DUF1080).